MDELDKQKIGRSKSPLKVAIQGYTNLPVTMGSHAALERVDWTSHAG